MTHSFVVRHHTALFMAAMLAAFTCSLAAGQEASEPSGDEAAIKAAIDSYVDAYNRGDAAAVAQHWSDDGEWLTPAGERVVGRAAIEKAMQDYFAGNNGVTIAVIDPRIRLIGDDVAIEEGRVTVTSPGEPAAEATYMAVHAKEDGDWKLTAVRETEVSSAATDPQPLDALAWLVGDWVDGDDESKNETSVAWTKGRNFLFSTFRVSAPGLDDLEGHQVIGWDPTEGVIRSWMFDSDGGFGAGVWTPEEGRWVVQFVQTLPDGGQASCTNIYTPVDADRYTWQSVNRVIDGEELTDLAEIEVVRQAAPPADDAENGDGGDAAE